MWRNFSHNLREKKAWLGIILPLWVFGSFIFVQVIVGLIYGGLQAAGVPFEGINSAVFSTVLGAIVYALTLLMVIGLPWLARSHRTSLKEVGLDRGPNWLELLLAPVGLIVYLILSAALVALAMQFLTFVDFNQTQDVGFTGISQRFELMLAFIMLVVIAPVAEEVLFRGYLFGKLRQHIPLWIAILITSVLFAIVHGAWNVGIDVFALSIILCLLRVVTGSLWPSILLHMLKNGIAFYLLFINPNLLTTLGG